MAVGLKLEPVCSGRLGGMADEPVAGLADA
jgi:hypothetical protein